MSFPLVAMPDSEVQNMQKFYQIPQRQVQITEYVILEGGKSRNLKRCTNPRAEENEPKYPSADLPDKRLSLSLTQSI